MFEIIRTHPSNGTQQVCIIDTVDETNVAFGSRCPVLVKMIHTKYGGSDGDMMVGEVLCPNVLRTHQEITISYTIKVVMDDGGILIENGVSPDRIRYRFGLDQLRIDLNSSCIEQKRMMGIRTNAHGVPLRKRQVRQVI